MSSPINHLLGQMQWTRLMWPRDVEPLQRWRHNRTGQEVVVIQVDDRYAVICKDFPPPARSWRIERAGLVARYTVEQATLRPELRRPPPAP